MWKHILTHSTTKVTAHFFFVVSDTTIVAILKCDWWCAASRAVLIGIVTGSVLLVVGLTLVAFYAVHQKKRAQRLVSINDPFGDALYLRITVNTLCLHLMLLLFLMSLLNFQRLGDQWEKILVKHQNWRVLNSSHWKNSSYAPMTSEKLMQLELEATER